MARPNHDLTLEERLNEFLTTGDPNAITVRDLCRLRDEQPDRADLDTAFDLLDAARSAAFTRDES
jgi:hypothetical protein